MRAAPEQGAESGVRRLLFKKSVLPPSSFGNDGCRGVFVISCLIMRHTPLKAFILVLCSLLFILCSVFCPVVSCLAEDKTTIQSDTLDYDEKTSTYTAKGHVKLERGISNLEAEEIIYNEKTSETQAVGNVIFEDQSVIIKGTRAELNLDTKTGVLYEAKIFSKKDNYHITGPEVEKVDEDEYTLKEARFTTCDAPVPAWCFQGKDVDLILGDRLKARNITFSIEDLPVLYTPYFSAPVSNERKTGLLLPSIGYVKSKGIHDDQPFYWAISETSDATFVLDEYTIAGTGTGLEYRFIETDGSKGNFWTYHLRDRTLEQDFWVLQDVYDNRNSGSKLTSYLNVDYVNSPVFYSEYNPYLITPRGAFTDPSSFLSGITQRFLESTGEVSLRLDTSRLYVDAQYLVDLQSGAGASQTLQKLPEIGYFLNPQRIGPLAFSLDTTLASFYRGVGVAGDRFDFYPKMLYAFGSDVVISQTLGLRETAYSLSGSDSFGSTPHRESFDYSINAQTRLVKQYPSFVHILEPSVQFTYIPPAESNLPLFDSTELYQKTSAVQLSLQNWFFDKNGEFLIVRVTQAYDSYADPHLMPLTLDVAVLRPVVLRAEVTYDVNPGRFDTINSDVSLPVFPGASLSLGERYSDTNDILTYTIALNYPFSKTVTASGSAWFDARSGGFQEAATKLVYQKQCWGVTAIFTKSQTGYGVSVLFNLLGIGTIRLF
ncbi:MAG: LPS assembly protein LptD [Thermodesulfovibrionales bacterium]|jgi:LPS-assembly protein